MITMRAITRDNWFACSKLKVKDGQERFVASNLFSMAQSKFFPETHIRAIYADETMVGFVMWGMDQDQPQPEMWIWRLMIDAEHQGKQYGHTAMTQLIEQLRTEKVDALFLSYQPDNTGAARFYAKLGFEDTGRVEHGETVVRLDMNSKN